MKKIFFLVMLIGVLYLTVQPAVAGTYRSPNYPYDWGYKAGDCTLVNERSEADATHVFTLNPDNTVNLNLQYWYSWRRNARCDELQFHVDHNTSVSRLRSWLDRVEIDRYKNMASSDYNGQTVSTSRYEWFLIKDGKALRIYDWLTALSWGLLIWDRRSIEVQTDNFYKYVTIGEPLKFNDGPYAAKIRSIWKNGDRDYSTLPARLAEEISGMNSYATASPVFIFDSCRYSQASHGSPYPNLLDWGWMAYNPGCPLAD